MTLYKTIADINGGTQVTMTAEEEAAFLAAQATHLAAEPRLLILAQIAKLESYQTPRRMREAIADPTYMNDLDAQIAELRAKL